MEHGTFRPKFDPDEPRDESGKWTDGGGGDGGGSDKPGSGGKEHPGPGYSSGSFVKDGVIHTTNVYDAQRALFEDRKVELNQPKQVSTLIKRLGEIAKKMAEQGKEAPVFNLCNVTVAGTNLFCADTKGIPRVEMPVIPAKQTKDFIKFLRKQGYKVEKGKEYAAHLRATQSEISGVKVAASMERIEKEGFYKRLVISKDDYILDGHHTWAGQLGVDAKNNNLHDDKSVKVARVDISITKLIAAAEKFTGGKGKKPASEAPKSANQILAALVREFDPDEPGDEEGKWTSGGGDGDGGSADAGAKPATEEQPLNPNVINVGGDQWNQATAKRLEREYQNSARPALEKLAQEATGKTTEVQPPEDDEGEPPFEPESWDMISASGQEQAKESYVSQNIESYHQSEVDNWYEGGSALDDAKVEVAYETSHGQPGDKATEWLDEAITDFRSEYDGRIPYTNAQLIDAINLDYQAGYEGKGDLTIDYDDKQLQEPSDAPPPGQGELPLPGVEPIALEAHLTQDMRDGLDKAINKAFDKAADDKSSSMEPPDYLNDSAKEFVEEDWDHNLDDAAKFEWVKNNTSIIEDESTAGTEAQTEKYHVDKLPEQFDPLNKTSGADYKRTQALARVLSVERAAQVLAARNLPVPSKDELSRIDASLWSGWKASSTNAAGKLLQIATADELGGRLNAKTATDLDPKDSYAYAKDAFKDIGGYAGVKAYVRAKWETTQYLLDKAGIHDLALYRGIRLDKETYEKLLALRRRALQSAKEVEGFKHLPALHVSRNGAASTTVSPGVANGWGADINKVVLRAQVPRTAAVSVPAYGINVHSEQEVVVAGTAWKGWDAWAGKAPTFDKIPLAA